MNSEIKLESIQKKENRVIYQYSVKGEIENYLQKDKEFFDILKSASLATPDSIGVIIGGKLQKKPFKERIPGQLYFRKAIEYGTKEGLTFYFLGGKEGIAKKAKENVLKDFPDCKIVRLS